ncbi:hypothetical protein COOONC_24135 [Cooperia oncophora]
MELKWEFEEGQQVFKVTNNTKVLVATAVNQFLLITGGPNYCSVVRSKGPLKKDKLVLCSKQVSADDKDAAEVFKTGVPNVDVIKMDQRIRV